MLNYWGGNSSVVEFYVAAVGYHDIKSGTLKDVKFTDFGVS